MLPEWCKLEGGMNHRVVRFCAAAGENNFRRLASEQGCQAFPCQIDSFSRLCGECVPTRRVAVIFCQERHHFLDHRRIQRRGGVVIEVNEFIDGYHTLLLLLLLMLVTTASVHHGGRQEFKVANLQLAVFFDENDFEIEVGIKILVLLQLLRADALSLGHSFKFLR